MSEFRNVRVQSAFLQKDMPSRAPNKTRYSKCVAALRQTLGRQGVLGGVEIDHTILDMVGNAQETNQELARPWLTIELCVVTRAIVRCYLSSSERSRGEV